MALHLRGYAGLEGLAFLLAEAVTEQSVVVLPSMREREGLEDLLPAESAPLVWGWRRLALEIFGLAGMAEPTVLDNIDRRLVVEILDDEATLEPAFLAPLADDLGELIRQGVEPDELGLSLDCDRCRESCPADEAPHLLCRLYHRYAAFLDGSRSLDAAGLEGAAARVLGNKGEPFRERWRGRSFLFVGFLSFTGGQLALIRRLAALDLTLTVLHPLTGLDDFPDCALQLADVAASVDERTCPVPPRLHRLSGGDGRLQTDLLCRELALWSRGEGAFGDESFPGWGAIAIAGADDTDRVEESLRRYRIPYVSRLRPALSEGIVWKLLRSAIEAGRLGWPWEETALLLSSPLLAGPSFPRVEARKNRPRGERAWRDLLASHEKALASFDATVRFIGLVEEGATAAGLLDETIRFLGETLAAPERMALLAEDDIDLDEEGRAVNGALKELARRRELLGRRGNPEVWTTHRLAGERAVAFLSLVARESSLLPPLPLTGAVSLYGAGLPVLTGAAVVALLDGDHRRWPGKGSEGPFLSEEILRRLHEPGRLGPLHLPTAAERRRAREGLFRRLVASGREILLCRALQDDSGRPLAETVFAEGALLSGWIGEGKRLELPLSKLVATASEPFVAAVEPLAEPRGKARSRPVAAPGREALVASLSGLDRFRLCPFLYSRDKLEGPREDLIDPVELGTFLHRVWQEALPVAVPEGSLPRAVTETFDALLQRGKDGGDAFCALLDRYGRQRAWLRDRLETMARHLEEAEASGLAGARRSSQPEADLPDLAVGGVRFRGRCDRMDVLHDGRLVLFDYKLGGSSTYRNHLQLAAYALALEERGQAIAGYAYLCHGDGVITGAFDGDAKGLLRLDQGARKDLKGELERAREALAAFAEALTEGRFAPRYDSDHCGRCACSSLCRRDELLREEESDDDGLL